MSAKEETSVKWLENCLPTDLLKDDYIKAIFKIAKEKEKQQIIDANREGLDMALEAKEFITGTEYYEKTFNNK